MTPEFLKSFSSDLLKYQKDFIKITAKPKDYSPLRDQLGKKKSKFLGIPFFPLNKKYPKDDNGTPMIMAAQINFEEIPFLEFFPDSGILQLFLSQNDWYEGDVEIVYHSKKELQNESISDFSFLKTEDFDEMPIFKVHELLFEKSIDYGGSEDCQFDFSFNNLDYWSFSETLDDEEQKELNSYFNASGHKIGGYAEFTQSDPRDYDDNSHEDIQVLQIDIDEHIMFGDTGLAHVFISQESLKNKDFSKAYFYWDCA